MSKTLSTHKFAKFIVIAILVLLPVVSIAGGLAITLLAFIMGLVGLSLHVQSPRVMVRKSPPFLMLMLLLLWLCISSIWSPYQPISILTNYIKLLIIGVVFYFCPTVFKRFSQADSLSVARLFLVTTFIGAVIIAIDVWTNFKITFFVDKPKDLGQSLIDAEMNLGHAITVLVLFSALVTILLKRRSRYWIILSVLFFTLIVTSSVLNNLWIGIIAAVAVIMAMILAFKFPRGVPIAILSFAVLTILFAPLLAFVSSQLIENDLGSIPGSWEHRLRMWGYCWFIIAENPIIGDGFDAARSYTAEWTTRNGVDWAIVSLHPHNAGIHIWTETGLIGALLAAGFISTLLKGILAYAKTPDQSAIVSGIMIAGILISSTTYGVWHSWWWGCLFMSAGLIYLMRETAID